jgi:hypothetical protein
MKIEGGTRELESTGMLPCLTVLTLKQCIAWELVLRSAWALDRFDDDIWLLFFDLFRLGGRSRCRNQKNEQDLRR